MTTGRDYTRLPEPVTLDSTVTGKDDRPQQDPDDLRSVEQLLGITEN
ncbi:hypothetical protein [Nocardioides caricicola]|uniref:Uncharacterized protein n=1 Tax=Nocardioides caricicola TaxID=634770 RepID=A0ABW0N401_9ACTN